MCNIGIRRGGDLKSVHQNQRFLKHDRTVTKFRSLGQLRHMSVARNVVDFCWSSLETFSSYYVSREKLLFIVFQLRPTLLLLCFWYM